MRLSHNMMFKNNLNSILNNQQEVNKAQEQVTTQKRVLSASDDPAAMARAMLYTDRITSNEQYTKNLTMLKSRLDTQEGVLENIKDSLTRAHVLSIQAGNGALGSVDRQALAKEVAAIQESVLELMNAKAEDGRFIFSGYQDNTRTYDLDTTTGKYVYGGDQGQHKIKVAEGVEIRSSDNGFDVFEKADKRLNVISNTGTVSGGVTSASVYVTEQSDFDNFHKANFNPDPSAGAGANTFTLQLASGVPNTYQIMQGASVIESGNFEGNNIKAAGIDFIFAGALPGQIDFDLEKPQKQNVLDTLENFLGALNDDSIEQDDYEQVLQDSIVGLLNAKNLVSQSQAALGGRMNVANRVTEANNDLDINNKVSKAELIELDMAEAITELSKHETALQASQATFGRLSNLSLLDYIR